MFDANRAPILHQDYHYLQTDQVKGLCLVLVISDNAQVLIMCLRLYVAKDD
jgi:hypothetical protein